MCSKTRIALRPRETCDRWGRHRTAAAADCYRLRPPFVTARPPPGRLMGPCWKAHVTETGCVSSSCPSMLSMAVSASFLEAYSTSAYPFTYLPTARHKGWQCGHVFNSRPTWWLKDHKWRTQCRTHPVRRSRLRYTFLMSPNSANASETSSSWASSWMPVMKITQPSTAAGHTHTQQVVHTHGSTGVF